MPLSFTRIITTSQLTLDRVFALFLLKKYGEQRFPGIGQAEITFASAGTLPFGKKWDDHTREGTVLLGMGAGIEGGHFDQGEPLSSVVIRKLGIQGKIGLRRLVARVREASEANYEPFHLARQFECMLEFSTPAEVLQLMLAFVRFWMEDCIAEDKVDCFDPLEIDEHPPVIREVLKAPAYEQKRSRPIIAATPLLCAPLPEPVTPATPEVVVAATAPTVPQAIKKMFLRGTSLEIKQIKSDDELDLSTEFADETIGVVVQVFTAGHVNVSANPHQGINLQFLAKAWRVREYSLRKGTRNSGRFKKANQVQLLEAGVMTDVPNIQFAASSSEVLNFFAEDTTPEPTKVPLEEILELVQTEVVANTDTLVSLA